MISETRFRRFGVASVAVAIVHADSPQGCDAICLFERLTSARDEARRRQGAHIGAGEIRDGDSSGSAVNFLRASRPWTAVVANLVLAIEHTSYTS